MRERDKTNGQLRTAVRAAMVLAAVLSLALLVAASASAAIRYAAPGGNDEAGSECLGAHPCSLLNAASRLAPGSELESGDEVLVEPGTYSGVADLGPEERIVSEPNVSIHGIAGQNLPEIDVSNGASAFLLDKPGQTLGRLEIIASGQSGAWAIGSSSSVIDGVVAVASGSTPCLAFGGLVRNSVCLSTGPFAAALMALPGASSAVTIDLRNVTAIATGASSNGLKAVAEIAGTQITVNGIGLLARGTAADVFGRGVSSAKTAVSLSHSDFADIKSETDNSGATATITEPGKGDANITADPLLAADGYHELPGSPTIDRGALDSNNPSLSGATDVDGNPRMIGAAPDIGADEAQLISTTKLLCAPDTLVLGASSACTATVSTSGASPTGTIELRSDGPGAFAGGGACTLAPAGPGEASCQLAYTPSAVGSGMHPLTASYRGDLANLASHGATAVRVRTKRQAMPNTVLRKKPPRKTKSRKARFSFASNPPGSRFECKLDRKPFKPCRSPFKHKVKRGRHRFAVRAVSPAGTDPTPAKFSWRVS